MGRPKNKVIPADAAAMDIVAARNEKADELYGDGFPFDQLRIEERIKARNANTAEMMVRNGKDYHWLKEYLPHGEFIAAVERTGVSRVWAYYCMKTSDLFSNVPTLEHLGVSQIRALTVLEKPVVEEYLNGGDLGDIPHDEVSKMPVRELEAEVRKLRQKRKEERQAQEDAIVQKEQKISELEQRLRYLDPPTEEQKRTAQAEKTLEAMLPDLYDFMSKAFFNLDEAVKLVVRAQAVPGVDILMLMTWAKAHRDEMKPLFDVLYELEDALNNICPDKQKDGEQV